MSEHTPGPWFVDKGPIYDSSSQSYVWGVTNDLTEDEETGAVTELIWVFKEADARLIAAAPDMFRILKELLMPCPPEYAEATKQRIKALIEKVES